MKTKKISSVLAIFLSAGMLLTGIANAAPEMFILEIQANGKGYEAVSNDGTVYTESKHKLDKFPLYAKCDRAMGDMELAYYNEVSGVWSLVGAAMVETENKLLVNVPSMVPIYADSIGTYYSSGSIRVQFKLKEGAVTKGKLKSLAMSYWQSGQYGPSGNMQRFGAVKMKGKKIDWDEVPSAVQQLWD